MAVLAVAVLVEFAARGPYRALSGDSQDLTVHYAAARVWLRGGNPYDMQQIAQAFLDGGGPVARVPKAATMPSVYPPVTHAVAAPMALLGWRGATIAMQVISLTLVVSALLALAHAMRLRGWQTMWLFVGGLALAPLHTGMAEGQVTIPSAALLILGWALLSERPALSGVLFAIGAALKPHLAVPFALVGVARPRPRWLLAGSAVFLGLLAVGELRLVAAGHDPIHDWLRNVALAAAPGALNSATPENPASLTLINLDLLLLRVLHDPALARFLGLALLLPIAALAVWRLKTASTAEDDPYAVSLLCVVSLLAMYHRVYDAVLLWIALAAVVRDWERLPRLLRAIAAVAFAAFLVPGPIALDVLARSGYLPGRLVESGLWQVLVLPHQVWLLSALALGLVPMLVEAVRQARSLPERPPALED